MKRITAIMMVVCMLFCGCAMPDVAETQDQQMPESIDTSADTSGDVQPPEVPEIKEGFFEKDLDGRITALKTNMSEVNRLKTDILNACG